MALRRASLPAVSYPEELPISQHLGEIRDALRASQVVVVAGETGSGKTTQLPKICLELGLGVRGMIGHTQPRRLAARSVAERIAEELGTPLGGTVGYSVRFTDTVSDRTLVKVMTDGILLAEVHRDRRLSSYDALIIDEAHERSLNIDFILGYLKRLLEERPELKVVVTSATIDTDRFSQHFAGAPVVEVSGRGYPVEIRYWPVADEADDAARDQVQAVCEAVVELSQEAPGDTLVFLSGEREIRDAAEALERLELRDTEVLPLYARLTAAAQHRVFEPHRGRRVVLATNVAETSLTVPGIRYVVDPGTARISRYNRRTKVQRLPIEPISQASAEQRAGRCGRVASGVCVRLYSEEDLRKRPQHTDPEILRSDLASVILRMAELDLGEVAGFPFLDPPDAASVRDGLGLLEELGALRPGQGSPSRRLTPLGRQLAQMPLDPRLGRMVLEAARNGCLREALVIATGLSIQDPRSWPAEDRARAAELHGRFAVPGSDFMAYLRLWEYVAERQAALSGSQFRRMCRAEHLHYLRIREWQDLHGQLLQVARSLGLRPQEAPAGAEQVHRSLLAALLSHVGRRDPERRDYVGARNARFALSPGSSLAGSAPRWVMAAELVETTRLWASVAAAIQPEWLERLGGHLLRYSYGEPWWERERGTAVAEERVTLLGLAIVEGRRVGYSRIDAAVARQLFIRHALVEGDWLDRYPFQARNQALLADLRSFQDRVRRTDLLVDEEALAERYGARVPQEVTTASRFRRWWTPERAVKPDLMDLRAEEVLVGGVGEVSLAAYPDRWRLGELELPVSYAFAPGQAVDGVTVDVPLAALHRLGRARFDWQVPGRRQEVVEQLLRTLPKHLRRVLGPPGAHVSGFLERCGPCDGTLAETLAADVSRACGTAIRPDDLRPDALEDHQRVRVRVLDEHGRPLAASRDIVALRRALEGRFAGALRAAASGIERSGLRSWEMGELPRCIEVDLAGYPATAYPALVDEGETAGVAVLADPASQERAMWSGTRRLLLCAASPSPGTLERQLSKPARLALGRAGASGLSAVLQSCLAAATDRLLVDHGGPVWTREAFEELAASVRAELPAAGAALAGCAASVLESRRQLEQRLQATSAPALAETVADIRRQLESLVGPSFVEVAGAERLPDLARYLEAAGRRLDKAIEAPARDVERMRPVRALQETYEALVLRPAPAMPVEDLGEIGWLLEELRVSVFAQTLGTRQPVSEQRVRRALERLAG